MKVLNLVQGTDEWLAERMKHHTASEASVMMGANPKVSRNDLLHMKATGDEQQFSRWVREVLFERGHEVEALGRPLAEKYIGAELYPVTATDDDGYLLASFDGITMLEDVVWECKQWNDAKAESVRNGQIPPEDRWQVVQQLVVSGAKRALYTVTDGTPEKTVHLWTVLEAADKAQLLAGWAQFETDLQTYEPPEVTATPVGRAPESLPALHIEVTGEVTASNLTEFKAHALAVFDGISTDLQTDEDFANAESTVKWCKSVEDKLEAAKEHALGQTSSIDELFRTIDDIKAEARTKRLELDKLVTERKQTIRGEIRNKGQRAFEEHMQTLNAGLPSPVLDHHNVVEPDFPFVMKGKRTIRSLRDAVDEELARAKIATSEVAEQVRGNFATFAELTKGHETLFADRDRLVFKARDDMEAAIKLRISEHEAAEKRKADEAAERERAEQARKDAAAALAERTTVDQDELRKPLPETLVPSAAAPQASTPGETHYTQTPGGGARLSDQANLTPPVPRDDLEAWKDLYDIGDDAYESLLEILAEHHALKAA